MKKIIFQKFIIIVFSLIITLWVIMTDLFTCAEEPKTFQELNNNWDKYSDQTTSPFVYRISKNPKQLPCPKILTQLGIVKTVGSIDSQHFCHLLSDNNVSFCIETLSVPSVDQAKMSMLHFIGGDVNSLISFYNEQNANSLWKGYKKQPGISRFFLSVKYEKILIGNFSFDKRYGGFEGHKISEIDFIRGNTVVTIFVPYNPPIIPDIKNIKNLSEYSTVDPCLSLLNDADLPDNPDPREIAWRINQYLKCDPLEKLSDAEKAKIKTLEITLPKDIDFEQGKEYSLDFPRRLSDGTIPSEIRLVVSRGEIQQVVDQKTVENTNIFPNPASLSPDVNGNYTVLFGQSGKQTIHCYHINEEGKCLAWGKTEVSVRTTTNPKSKGENK